MAKEKMTGLLVNGSVRTAGVTFYTKNGKTVMRAATSNQPRRNSRSQFIARQRMKHTTALWSALKDTEPMFSGGKSAYGRFCTLASTMPAVFTPRQGEYANATLLLPGMPVSDGTLPIVKQSLGRADGTAALVTELKANALGRNEELRLYCLRQTEEGGTPKLRISYAAVPRRGEGSVGGNTYTVILQDDGTLALAGTCFADDNTGWALVRIDGERCSSQTVVTRCRRYEAFTTDEAMRRSAESYGGLTD